jgi:uncharacterized RmlC-like cupin family protein
MLEMASVNESDRKEKRDDKSKACTGERSDLSGRARAAADEQEGICSDTVDRPHLKIYHVLIPAGAKNQRHYHINCDAGMHVLKGRLKMTFGPDREMEEVIAEEGDFFFVPAGIIHGLENLSTTEPAEIVADKNNVSTESEEGSIFI